MTINLDRAAALYFEALAADNHSPSTVKNYSNALKVFSSFLRSSGINDLEDVSGTVIAKYQGFLAEEVRRQTDQPYSIRTQSEYLKAVSRFFHYLCDNGYLADNPARHIKYPRHARPASRAGKALSPDEVKRILRQPFLESPLGYRDRTILELLYSTGITIFELRSLDIKDVNLRKKRLFIKEGRARFGKKKARYVPIDGNILQFLEGFIYRIRPEILRTRWQPQRHWQAKETGDILFINKFGYRMEARAICAILNKYCRTANIRKPISSYSLRDACAVHRLKGGTNMRHVQALLGHKKVYSIRDRYSRKEVFE